MARHALLDHPFLRRHQIPQRPLHHLLTAVAKLPRPSSRCHIIHQTTTASESIPRAGKPRRARSWSKNSGGTALPNRPNKTDALGVLTHQNINHSFCFVQRKLRSPHPTPLHSPTLFCKVSGIGSEPEPAAVLCLRQAVLSDAGRELVLWRAPGGAIGQRVWRLSQAAGCTWS